LVRKKGPAFTTNENRLVRQTTGLSVASKSYFYGNSEVEEVALTRDPTWQRMERRGEFPAHIHIVPRRIASRCTDIQAWVADPEGWAGRTAGRSPHA
jgi:hypothetical protein